MQHDHHIKTPPTTPNRPQTAANTTIATTLLITLTTTLITTKSATAAQPRFTPQNPFTTPVDEGIADVSPLAVGRHRLDIDLNASRRFDQVFALPPGFGPDSNVPMFARSEGAVTAVFPMSVYQPIRDRRGRQIGVGAAIPPGAIFYIGELPQHLFNQNNTSSTNNKPTPPSRTTTAHHSTQPTLTTSTQTLTQISTKLPTQNPHQPAQTREQLQQQAATNRPATTDSTTTTHSTSTTDTSNTTDTPPKPDMSNDTYRARVIRTRLAELTQDAG